MLAWHSSSAPKPHTPLGSMMAHARRWHLGSARGDSGTKARYFQPTESYCTRRAPTCGHGCSMQGANARGLFPGASQCPWDVSGIRSLIPARKGRCWELSWDWRAQGEVDRTGARTELELLPGEEPGEKKVWERRKVCPPVITPGLQPHTCHALQSCSLSIPSDMQLQDHHMLVLTLLWLH